MEGVTGKIKWALWLIWICVFPAGLYYSYQIDPPSFDSLWIPLSLIALAIIFSFLPFTVDSTTIFIIHWINLAAFLTYGLFFELILMQIVLIPLLLKSGMTWNTSYRYALNSTMMLMISIIAGLTYYYYNFSVTEDSLWRITVGAGLYIVIHIVFNHFYLYFFSLIVKNGFPFFSRDTLFDYLATLLSMPYGLAFYFLLNEVGLAAVFYLGLPFLAVAIVLRLYNNSEQVNEDLGKAGKIGHQLAAQLEVNEVLDLFVKKLTELMPVDYAYILDVEEKEQKLKLLRRYENEKIEFNNLAPVLKGEGISGNVWVSEESVLYNKKIEWNEKVEGYMPRDTESILSVPIKRNNKTVAVLLVASKRKNAYRPHLVPIVDLLCSYFAVAIQNARNHQKTITRSERCALTGLYNYRYFDERLGLEFSQLDNGGLEELSLLLVDIDHFKKINDTYGHQSGNELLRALASTLYTLVGDKGVVARYGGEEFVVLLCDVSKEEALIIAENIRKTVEETVFQTSHELSDNREAIDVKMTVSIGVSTAPEDTDDAQNLMRNADRALYIGAKRAGRNRVAAGA
ncbi:sensor domain-containing diguanylate cyclase [Jeotgalibacillus sp. ET6]|uniref:sensor domain-containing diguanylate cyclase n=1 Tax=Jeotgalibacillus sp. ET6 TaxID=3037260 RepID=UPI0024184537|nr:sensor domain-containing diguanylate cyclase [Jeotgalibacillus sp. ET6]MDG5470970.1 sensor domain-containing diguanylate cyclase [Jeotgalibacillus sp. ET6]